MKKNILLFLLLLAFYSGFGQITLDTQYNIHHKVFYLCEISPNEFKYVVNDSTGFSLYNLDYSPYLLDVISPILLDSSPQFYQISYISKSLFDCDSSNVEYAITQPVSPSNYYVYRTDGTLLFEKDSVTGYYGNADHDGYINMRAIVNTPVGTKLYLSDNKFSGQDSIYIYSLCGSLPESVQNNLSEIPHSFVFVFPNPSSGIINFRFNPPEKGKKYYLKILDSVSRNIKNVALNESDMDLELNINSFSSGIYYFQYYSESKLYQVGKFVVSK